MAIVVPPVEDNDELAWLSLDAVIHEKGETPSVLTEFLERVLARFPFSNSPSVSKVWSVAPESPRAASKAAVFNFSYSSVSEVLPAVVEIAHALNLEVFDLSSKKIYRVKGLSGITLEAEGLHKVDAPLLSQVQSLIDTMTPNGGPSFLILSRGDKDYAQVAGGDGVFCVEWREYRETEFSHSVAGYLGTNCGEEVAVPTNGFFVKVFKNEQLKADNVKEILAAFVHDSGRPNNYTWRDITHRFVSS